MLLGVGDYHGPSLVERFPDCRVRESRYDQHELGIEHLRIPSGTPVRGLPGLDGEHPSLLRDAMLLAMAGGTPDIDLLYARVRGAKPWELTRPDVAQLLTRALGEVGGSVVVLPDAAGPLPLGSDTSPADPDGLIAAVRTYGPVFAEHYQLGVVDVPAYSDPDLFHVLQSIKHHDICATSWTGRESDLQRHGWRCGSAWFGSRIASRKTPMESATAVNVPLPGGRARVPTRFRRLGGVEPTRALPDFAREAFVELEIGGDRISALSEPTLRGPIGLWDVPLVRTAKILHHRVAITANLFVFQSANDESAIMLQTALMMALQDFVRRDVLEGPEGGAPQVHAVPDRNPAQPSLIATVRAFLKPWMRELRIDLAVRPGEAVTVEVA